MTRRTTVHLKAYLDYLDFKERWKAFMATSMVAMGLGAAGALTAAISVAIGALGPGTVLWVITNVVAALVVAGATSFAWLRRRRPVDQNPALLQESRSVRQRLKDSLSHNRLHREMHPAAVELLEAAAHSWRRIHDSTAGSYWSSPDLPLHYQGVRKKAMASADQAMAEVLLHLQLAIKPLGEPKTLMEGIHSMLDAIGLSVSSVSSEEPLPEGYESASSVANSLSDLAAEIEATPLRAVGAKSLAATSADSIRKTLQELHQIRDAESELETDLRIGR